MQRSIILSELRVRVTGASVDYVGSVTIHEEMCDALGLIDRQMVQIRSQGSGVDLWTYVIRGINSAEVPPGTLCLNGAAAHLVSVGDIVTITARGMLPITKGEAASAAPRRFDAVRSGVTNAISNIGLPPTDWANNVTLEYACGKVHRARITHVAGGEENVIFPGLYLDEDWAKEGGLINTEAVHVVNVTNGQRDILTVHYAPSGSKRCAIHLGQPNEYGTEGYGSRSGYREGDVVIAMSYGFFSRSSILQGSSPPMKICFPFERPNENPDGVNLYEMWDRSVKVQNHVVLAEP